MDISRESLLKESEQMGFRPEILEKVWRLMGVLEEINIHPLLRNRLVLKGGTALNLFVLDLPRLSVDIDLNYIGAQDRETMMKERPQIEKALETVFERQKLIVRRIPDKHAGGKWRLQYNSSLAQQGTLEVDLNFMFRIPLWDVQRHISKSAGTRKIGEILILDVHELAAGKFTALFARHAARDLFDAHHLLTTVPFDPSRLRLAFVLYVGMSSMDWRTISSENLSYDGQEFHNQLLPVSSQKNLFLQRDAQKWADRMIQECRQKFQLLLPFSEHEKEFLHSLSENGEIRASLLTNDSAMKTKIEHLPLLKWRAQLALKNKGIESISPATQPLRESS